MNMRLSTRTRLAAAIAGALLAVACSTTDRPSTVALGSLGPLSTISDQLQVHICKFGDGPEDGPGVFNVTATSGVLKLPNPVSVEAVDVNAPRVCTLVWEGDRTTPVVVTVTELPSPGLVLERTLIHGFPGAPGVSINGATITMTDEYMLWLETTDRPPHAFANFKNNRTDEPQSGRIGDFVWRDNNNDGVQDAGEPGIPGQTVSLVRAGEVIATTVTDANGGYLFTNLTDGCYTVMVDTPAGLTPSPTGAGNSSNDSNGNPAPVCLPTNTSEDLTIDFGFAPPPQQACPVVAAVPALNNLTNLLFLFADGSTDANWQGATKGFSGNVVVDGISAKERTSGGVPYAGTIYTNDATLGAWQNIVNQNAGQAFAVTGAGAMVAGLESDLANAFTTINGLGVNAPAGFTGTPQSLNGLNTQNGLSETFVLNVTAGFQVSSKINITGDAGDVFILRWDNNLGLAGYQGEVKFQSGGAIVPLGGLTPASFVHVAGDINASGGGSNPAVPFPQGPGIPNGANWNGGGFFTGYWLTTGNANRETHSLSNAIFVGGWYTTTVKFSMTSGTSGVHVPCPR